ncbi:MAG TPA: hypothetical protein VIG90_17145 [Pedomonas sp.]|uniref:hypothetical protein n=1 Tax=Pedomonas sp. TaxID=2976421 RepID=UPI002F3F5700
MAYSYLPASSFPSKEYWQLAAGRQIHDEMPDTNRKFAVGDEVKLREGSSLEIQRYAKRRVHGIVIEALNIPGYGYGIKVQWPDEPSAWAFSDANLFDPVGN